MVATVPDITTTLKTGRRGEEEAPREFPFLIYSFYKEAQFFQKSLSLYPVNLSYIALYSKMVKKSSH